MIGKLFSGLLDSLMGTLAKDSPSNRCVIQCCSSFFLKILEIIIQSFTIQSKCKKSIARSKSIIIKNGVSNSMLSIIFPLNLD